MRAAGLEGRAAASERAKARLLSLPREPLFLADWERALMIHYEVDPGPLQAAVPFELDFYEGRAYVSLVAFTMRGMRPRFGGRIAEWMLRPIATHNFLNLRTYVRHREEPGIYFMTEWLSNRLSVALGPCSFGLPYRFARISYEHNPGGERRLVGRVEAAAGQGVLSYSAVLEQGAGFGVCDAGTLDEWLMERYTAYTSRKGHKRFFRVWHEPWAQMRVRVQVGGNSLVTIRWPFLREARIAGANYSPGVRGVWMGRPHGLDSTVGQNAALRAPITRPSSGLSGKAI